MKLFKILLPVFSLIFVFGIIFESCTRIKLEPLVCFQEDVLPIMNSHCATVGCHNTTNHRAGRDYSNYDGIKRDVSPRHPKASEIISIIKGGEMPPSNYPALTDAEIALIEQWISLGAVNSSNCNTSSCDTNAFTYNVTIQPLLTKYCTGCHNSASSVNGDFTNFTILQTYVTNGSLLGSIKHVVGLSEMPKNLPKLSDCQIRQVEKWINAGALNN